MRRFVLAAFTLVLATGPAANAMPTGGGGGGAAPSPTPLPSPPVGVAACGPVQSGYGEVTGNLPNPKPGDPAYASSYLVVIPSSPAADNYIGTIYHLVHAPNPVLNTPSPGGTPSAQFQDQANVATAYMGVAQNLDYAHINEVNGYFDCKGITTTFTSFDAVATVFETLPQNPANIGQPCSSTNICTTVSKYYLVKNQSLLGTVLRPLKNVLTPTSFQYMGSSPSGYKS